MSEADDNSERMKLAIGQIERALSRMENAVAKFTGKPRSSDANNALAAQLEDIRSRHAQLRSAAENAIRQIDHLTGQE